MEQLMKLKLSGDIPCLSSIPLGTYHNNKYYIDDECLTHLEEINGMLKREDPNTRPLRRAIGFMDILNKDLIPILVSNTDQPKIFHSTIKLLVELTTPVECLVSVDPSNRISPSQLIVIHELTQLLCGAKESFRDGKTTQVILNHLVHTSEKQLLSSEDCQSVNHSLLLIRNILHAPERSREITVGESQIPDTTSTQQQQNRILWNLFAQGLNHLLINLLDCSERWSVTIVQLISLFYKDRPIEAIQKVLRDDGNSYGSSEDDGPSQFNKSRRSSQESVSSSVFHSDSFTAPHATSKMTSPGETDQQETETFGQKFTAGEGTFCDSRNDSQTDKPRHSSSEQSASSGFYSEDSGILKCNISLLKDYDVHKKKSSKRLCRDSSQKDWSNRNFHTNIPTAHPANPVSPMDGSLENDSNIFPPDSVQPCTESGIKRNIKGYTKNKKTPLPEKEQRRNKFSGCNNVEIDQGFKLFEYTPTEKDITHILKEFTVDFLFNGYNTLVSQLYQQLLKQGDIYPHWDKSHFFWLICYFLPIATQLEISVEHLKDVLTIDTLCYLTWEAVHQTEELEICKFQSSVDLLPCVRRLHLSVTAIREYVQTLESYFRLGSQPSLIGSENLIIGLRGYVPAIRDLRQLFLLQLRQFNPIVQSRRYLLDVIATNHVLLLTLDRVTRQSSRGSFDFNQHLTQFCSKVILDRYGTALEDFKTNGPFVNDCILTLLHHVAGDLGRADILCRPVILRPFMKIWKEEFDMCDDWKDVIEFVTRKSLHNFQKKVRLDTETSPSSPDKQLETAASASHSTETLPLKYSAETKLEKSADRNNFPYEVSHSDIESLLIQLKDSGFQKQLDWIQSSLLSACAARLGAYAGQEFRNPITSLSFQMNLSCPVVPWTEVEETALRSELFLFLLLRIGLIPPSPQAVLYPRIPREWSPDTLYSVALLFGPVDQERIDFNLNQVKKIELHLPNSPINALRDATFSFRYSTRGEFPFCDPCYPYNSLQTADPQHLPYLIQSSGSRRRSKEMTSPGNSSFSDQLSLRAFDRISTTSSLQVHKSDSTDDDEETGKMRLDELVGSSEIANLLESNM